MNERTNNKKEIIKKQRITYTTATSAEATSFTFLSNRVTFRVTYLQMSIIINFKSLYFIWASFQM